MKLARLPCTFAALSLALIGSSNAFMTPSTQRSQLASMTLPRADSMKLNVDAGTGWDNFCIENIENNRDINPEEARKFRRTVYSHDDWKKHRQQDRFFIYLGSLFSSGIFRNSEREVLLCTAIATAVCAYNAVATGYTDLVGVQHGPIVPGLPVLGIPMTAFTITSSSLGLLLSKFLLLSVLLINCCGCSSHSHVPWPNTPSRWYSLANRSSLSRQHVLQTLGRSSQELGNEH